MREKFKLSNYKLRSQLIFIVVILILLPFIASFIIYRQLNKIENNTRKDAEKSLSTQLNSMLKIQSEHQAAIINHHFDQINRETYNIGLVASKIVQDPESYIDLKRWNLKDRLFKEKGGQYSSRQDDRVNVFFANFVVLDKEMETLFNATSYLDQFFEVEYNTQEGITNVYLLLYDYTFIRLYPNNMQTKSLAPNYKFKESYFLRATAGKDLKKIFSIWTYPYQDPAGEGEMVTCLSGVYSKKNRFMGVVGTDVAIKTILEKFTSEYEDKDIFSFIIDINGNVIAMNEEKINYLYAGITPEKLLNIIQSKDPDIKKLGQEIVRSPEGLITSSFAGKQRFFAYSTVPSTGWRFVITASQDEINKQAAPIISKIHNEYRIIRIIWLVMLALLGYFCVDALVRLSKNVVDPLSRLAEGAKALERGEVPKPLNIEGKNEIATFARSFDTLVKSLLQRQNDVNSIQRFLRNIVKNSPDMIIVADSNNKIMEFNQAAEMMLGYSSKDLIGLGLELLFYDLAEYNDLIKTVTKETRISGNEITMITQNGDPIEISLSLALIKDDKGTPTELIAIGKDITERKEKEREVLKRVRQLEMLHKTIFASASIMDMDYLLKMMAKTIQETFQYHSVEIYTIDSENSEVLIGGKAGPYKYLIPDKCTQKFSDGIVGLVARTGETYLCQNIQEDPYYLIRFLPFTRSELTVPIKSGNDIIGVVNIEQTEPNAFDAQDILTIEAISAGIYSSVKNIELYKSLKKRIDELTVFYECSNILMSTLNLDDLLKKILAILEKTFHYSNAAIFQMDENDSVLRAWSFYGYPDEFKDIVVPLGQGITGWAAQQKATMVIADVTKEPRYICTLQEVRSEISIPLMRGDKIIGVLDVGSEYNNYFKQNEINLLTSLATQIAMTIDNAALYKQLEFAHRKLKESFIGILKALTAAIEAKDSYTDGHVQRTSSYAELVAKELRLSNDMIETVKYASILHDIGKIGIPESILLKPGKLSAQEKRIMQRHPEIGVNIIKDIDFLKNTIPAILYHQERFDGNMDADFPAYPNGLKENEIPMAAHIVAVVDAYDAMTSNRPYRNALSQEEAIKVLLEEKGKQFHPEVVDAFVRVLKRNTNSGSSSRSGGNSFSL